MTTHKCSRAPSKAKESVKPLKLLLTSACLVLYLSILTCAQGSAVLSKGDSKISLSFELQRISIDKSQEIIIRYRVKNKGRRDIYLVITREPTHGVDQSKKELFIYLEKQVLNYHYFELPKLRQISAGKDYRGEARLPSSFLQDDAIKGEWSVFLSIGYVESKAMAELRVASKGRQQTELAQPFEKAQKTVSAGPSNLSSIRPESRRTY